MNTIINPAILERLPELTAQFAAGEPKHVVLDGFLLDEVANALHEHFPSVDSLKVKRKSLNENKVEDYHFERWDPVFTEVRNAIRSSEFTQWMSSLTGIENLQCPDDALGSGLHQGGQGSFVDVHIDVNFDPKLKLWRRINLLIYLNRHWDEAWGGHLELWDAKMSKVLSRVAPLHNRAILFLTDETSPHGYKAIDVPEGESRKSFYAYYFTEVSDGFKYSDSRFIARPDDGMVRRSATAMKEWAKIRAKRVLKALGVTSLDFQDKNR
ncbi:MAG: 2OG-Fe(II) oxygenase [Schleiferiaceae bacterium]|nr:2OG-Fe(II) oxygenase [Schleiferiaceae bacterium]